MPRREKGGARTAFTGPAPGWSDERLVSACLAGSDLAWAALIDKYKKLIYSIARKYGASPEDAADIFQLVCVELFSELPRASGGFGISVRSCLVLAPIHRHLYELFSYDI